MADQATMGKKWKVIKERFLLSKNNDEIDQINTNGVVLTDTKLISEELKKHFETCAAKLVDDLPQGEDTVINMQQGETWDFETTTELELVEIIKSLLPKNSAGYIDKNQYGVRRNHIQKMQ
jgi:hypothetical protein